MLARVLTGRRIVYRILQWFFEIGMVALAVVSTLLSF
jgi:hypothetical protein